MPDNAIVAALRCLVPSLPATNKPFPPPLLSQAESYLALSRQRASHLKPEEEIARAHACAEIACNNLRAQLRLPAIKNGAGAPCKPKLYTKLVKFLEGLLNNATIVGAGSTTPRGRKRDSEGNVRNTLMSTGKNLGSQQSLVSKRGKVGMDNDHTPTKNRTPALKTSTHQFVGTIRTGRKATQGDNDDNDDSPSIVMPWIRKLCKMFSTPTMAPHVYTGTCVVLGLAGLWPPVDDDDDNGTTKLNDDDLKAEILTLVTALYLMVLTRMQEDQMTTEIYTTVSSRSTQELDLSTTATDKIEEWIDRLNERKWCEGQDWWESVPESVLIFDPDASPPSNGEITVIVNDSDDESLIDRQQERRLDRPGVGDLHLLEEADQDDTLLPGLGTMLHAGIDWNSEEKCLVYDEWHARLLKRLGVISKTSGRQAKSIAVA